MIDVKSVSRSYHRNADNVHALDNISVHIEAGHFVAFVGPSGSGKSTLLHVISAIDRPNACEVIVARQAAQRSVRGRAGALARPARRSDVF